MSGPIAESLTGKLRGSRERGIEGDEFCAFRGIPYARPPVGQLRFQDPEPAEPWTGVRDALEFGQVCAHKDVATNEVVGGDDCLYLNVYARTVEPSRRRPVMVWIHGGGFVFGDGSDKLYGPDYFMRKDVVLVTINYRLGVLGFLNLEDHIAPGNQGLKDQVLALKWVRDNIANFGGDPDNVTIFGESAGGASVHYLTLSPMAKGLFHKAICQSGVVLCPWAHLTHNPKRFAYQMCSLLGKDTRDHKEIVEFFKSLDSQKLIEVQEKLLTVEEKMQLMFPFGPGVDAQSGKPFMPIHPTEAAKRGVQVPLLIGYTSREGILFLSNAKEDFRKLNHNFQKYLNSNCVNMLKTNYDLSADELMRMYYNGDEVSNENCERLVDLIGDMYFVEGIHRVVKTQIERSSAPTYLYEFNFDKSISAIKLMLNLDMKGACHGDELQHQFRMSMLEKFSIEPMKKGSAPYKIMEQMIELWVNFATTGRPTPAITDLIPFYWLPVCNENVLRYLNIGEDLRMDATVNLHQRFIAHKIKKNKL